MRIRWLVIASLLSLPAAAQPELTAAVQFGYPFLLNRQGYYNSPAPAVLLNAGWRLPYSRLYPSVQVSYGVMDLALYAPASGFDDLNMQVEMVGSLLLLNTLLKTNEYDEIILSGGLGITGLAPIGSSYAFSNAGGPVARVESTGSTLHLSATGKLGLKILHRTRYSRSLWVSAEASCQYFYLYEQDEYRLLFPNAAIGATASGHLLMPAVQVGLCWKFGNQNP